MPVDGFTFLNVDCVTERGKGSGGWWWYTWKFLDATLISSLLLRKKKRENFSFNIFSSSVG